MSQSEVVSYHRIVIIDDMPMMRLSLLRRLQQEPDFLVCGTAASVHEGVWLAQGSRPDVALIDAGRTGKALWEEVLSFRRALPGLPLLVFTGHDALFYAVRLFQVGVRGYLSKDVDPATLMQAIRHIRRGELIMGEAFRARLLQEAGQKRAVPEVMFRARLSDREVDVLDALGNGQSPGQIAARLGVSVKTVETHCAHVRMKLGLRQARELLLYAIHWRLSNTSGPGAAVRLETAPDFLL
ncbi:MAG: response regulator [Candidatus Tectimicrobiota bacterium]